MVFASATARFHLRAEIQSLHFFLFAFARIEPLTASEPDLTEQISSTADS
jgi:hypothetical protein